LEAANSLAFAPITSIPGNARALGELSGQLTNDDVARVANILAATGYCDDKSKDEEHLHSKTNSAQCDIPRLALDPHTST